MALAVAPVPLGSTCTVMESVAVLQSVREEFGSCEVAGFTLKASRGFSDRLEQLFVWLGGRSGLGDEAWAFGMVPRVALSVGSGDRSRSLASRVVRWWSLSSIAQGDGDRGVVGVQRVDVTTS